MALKKKIKEVVPDEVEEQVEAQADGEESSTERAVSKLKVKLDAYRDEQNEKLKIDKFDLDDDFHNQPSNYFLAAAKHAKAVEVLDTQKQKLDEVMGDVYLEAKAGAEKTTEAHLEKLCKNDPAALKQKSRVILAQYQVNVHYAVMKAWEHKRDMLIQVGAFQRAEMAGQVGINKNHPNHDDAVKIKNGRPASL